MIVYVETNFVLQLALEQEHSIHARQILLFARRHRIRLFMPWFCLGEAYAALNYQIGQRKHLAEECASVARELSRTVGLEQRTRLLYWFRDASREVGRIGDEQVEALDHAITNLLTISKMLIVDATRVRQSIRARRKLGLRPSDSIVYGCIRHHALNTTGDKCFLNNDSAFHQPKIVRDLKRAGTTVKKLDAGAAFLKARFRSN